MMRAPVTVFLFAASLSAQVVDIAPAPIGRLVDIGGRRLHLNCTGRGSPTVIVENAANGFSIDWALVQSEVAKRTRICTYDRAGFAWSDRGPAPNTVEETVDDLRLMLRAAAIKPPYVLAGASIGGMFVRAYQRRYPSEVAGLVLVDATADEDLEYTVNGTPIPLVKMTYEHLEGVFAPLLGSSAPGHELPTKIEPPYDRLPKELQPARLWASRLLAVHSDASHAWVAAESWRQEFFALRKHRLQRLHALGDLPLVVISRGKKTSAALQRRQSDLGVMSSVGKHMIAIESESEIVLEQPDFVAKAIGDVVDAAAHRSKQ